MVASPYRVFPSSICLGRKSCGRDFAAVTRVRQSHKSAVYGWIGLGNAKTRKIGARILGDYRKYLLGIRRFRKMYWTVFPGEIILLANLSMERIRVSRGASKAILVKATQDSRGVG